MYIPLKLWDFEIENFPMKENFYSLLSNIFFSNSSNNLCNNISLQTFFYLTASIFPSLCTFDISHYYF